MKKAHFVCSKKVHFKLPRLLVTVLALCSFAILYPPFSAAQNTLVLDTAGGNLARNSSFESSVDGRPRQWNYQLDSTTGNTFISAEGIYSGKYGLKFLGGGNGNFGISQPEVKTAPQRTYTISAFVKVVNAPRITLRIGFWDEYNDKRASLKETKFVGTKDWTRVWATFTTSGKITDTTNCFAYLEITGLSRGSVYIDDIQVVEGSLLTRYDSSHAMSAASGLTLGDGAIIGSNQGDLFPAVSGLGSLGTTSKKWSALYLDKATLDKDGGLTLSGGISLGSALSVPNGGTGATSLTQYGVLYGGGTSAISALTPGTSGYVLQSNGTTSAPSWVSPSESGTVAFGNITTGTNASATMTVGSGASLTTSGTGTVNANKLNGFDTSLGGALTTGGAFTTSGANSLTFTTTAATSLTLPTSGTLSTLAGIETLTNKTLTSPQIGTSILDTSGHQFVGLSPTTNAVNYISLTNAAVGSNPSITLTGTDTDIGMTTIAKGAGSFIHSSTISGSDSLALLPQSGTTTGAFTGTVTTANLTGNRTFTFPDTDGTVTLQGNTTTGTGSIVLATSPTLTTPNLGVATATSVNGLTFTANSTGFSVAGGTTSKTLTLNNSLLLAGTDGTTITFQGSDTYVGRTTSDTLTNKTLSSPTVSGTVTGSSSPTITGFGAINGLTLTSNSTGFSIAGGTTSKTITANNSLTFAGTDSTTITFQGTDTYVGRTTSDTLTNKTLTAPTITGNILLGPATTHLKSSQTTAPTSGTPASCGVTPTSAVVANSTDMAGSFTITAGTGVPVSCDTVISFQTGYGTAPKAVLLTPVTSTAPARLPYISAVSTASFTVTLSVAPVAGQANTWYYWVIE